MVVLVNVIAKKAASVSSDAAKQSSPLLEDLRNLVVLMEKLLTFNLHTASPRGFDGKTPNFQPPHSKPTRGFDGRTPNFGPPSRSRSPQGRPSPDRESRYKEMMKKFDKNKDGRLDEKERDTARKFMQERFKSER